MVARKATDEQIVTAIREGGSYYAAARLLDMAESSVRERAKRLLAGRDDGAALAERGLLGTEPVLLSKSVGTGPRIGVQLGL